MNTTTPTGDRGVRGHARTVLLAIVVVAAATILAASSALAPEIGERIATHWGGDGPDGSMPVGLLTLLMLALATLLGGGFVLAAERVPDRYAARTLAATGVGVAVFLATVHVGTLLANRGLPPEAVPLPASTLLAAFGGAALASVVGWLLGPDGDPDGPVVLDPATLVIEPGEAVVWTGGARAEGWFVLLPVGLVVLAIVLVSTDERAAAIGVAIAAVATWFMLRLRVTVGPAGVLIRGGPGGILRSRVPLEVITGVTAEHVEPLAHGGWGYRIIPGARAVIVRRGPGLRIRRGDRPDVVVTVDDAPEAAGVLLAHLAVRDAARS